MEPSKDTYSPDSGATAMQAEKSDPALLRLNELLSFPPVEVPSDFAETVMQRVRESSATEPTTASSRSSWIAAAAGALALLSAVVWLGGSSGSESESVFGTMAAALTSVLLAGAGMLSATWHGVGSSVGSWLGTSPTTGAFIALAFVGSLLAFVGGLRRARQSSRSK